MSSPARSSSSADRTVRAYEAARAGDSIAGFRLERLIGRGEAGAVYEATQKSIGRSVALRLIDPALLADPEAGARLDRELGIAASLHHPGLVPVYEAGEWAGGRFVAMRLIRGRTLSSPGRNGPEGTGGPEALDAVAAGLEAAHRAGLSHGGVRAGNVLVDGNGRAYLADLGLGRGTGPEADDEQLAALRAAAGAPTGGGRSRDRLGIVAAILAAATVLALVVGPGSGGESDPVDEPPPPAPEGTVPLGSSLSPGPAAAAGCGEGLASASSCTVVPVGPGGRALRATRPGVIRGWAVRGASGELTLQVLRPGPRLTRQNGFSQPVRVPDQGPHAFRAELGLGRGEIVAVRLSPGAELGRRGDGAGARVWPGAALPLPSLALAEPLRGELLVRVDFDAGAAPSRPDQLTGTRAARAPAGDALDRTTVAVPGGDAVQVRLVVAEGRVQVDAFAGGSRAARLPLEDADPEGQPVLFEQNCGHPRSVCLRWLNPGAEAPLFHEVRIAPDGRFRVIG